ncbi:MAG: hypothetical protein A2V90_06150 [Gammaproteobacteria bacterium RBG_16_57_12]|nr:MAG: hypothetical protein A2V90_06150 [Gammaproteobacteria bacterium RBG_16_57_12]
MSKSESYVGIHDDLHGGMTPTGTVIRDAWVFGLIAENEDCKGWDKQRLLALYDQVHEAWLPYAHLVSHLPAELRERHARIYDAAISGARAQGWNPELGDED